MASKNTAQPARRWLTQLEAAEHIGVTDRTIRNMIARGELTGRRIGKSRMIRIDAHELDELLRPIPTAAGNAS